MKDAERAVCHLVRKQMDELREEILREKSKFLSHAKEAISKKAGTTEMRKKERRFNAVASRWLDKAADMRRQAEALECKHYDEMHDEAMKYTERLRKVDQGDRDLQEKLFLQLTFGTKGQLEKLQETIQAEMNKLRVELVDFPDGYEARVTQVMKKYMVQRIN